MRGTHPGAARHPLGAAVADVAARDGAAHGSGGESWFRRTTEGVDLERHFQDEDGGFEFGDPTQELVDEAFALLHEEVAHAREVLERTDLDTLVDVHGDEVEVRDIVVHLVEEYARHVGHADLLRECVDGRTGQ